MVHHYRVVHVGLKIRHEQEAVIVISSTIESEDGEVRNFTQSLTNFSYLALVPRNSCYRRLEW